MFAWGCLDTAVVVSEHCPYRYVTWGGVRGQCWHCLSPCMPWRQGCVSRDTQTKRDGAYEYSLSCYLLIKPIQRTAVKKTSFSFHCCHFHLPSCSSDSIRFYPSESLLSCSCLLRNIVLVWVPLCAISSLSEKYYCSLCLAAFLLGFYPCCRAVFAGYLHPRCFINVVSVSCCHFCFTHFCHVLLCCCSCSPT